MGGCRDVTPWKTLHGRQKLPASPSYTQRIFPAQRLKPASHHYLTSFSKVSTSPSRLKHLSFIWKYLVKDSSVLRAWGLFYNSLQPPSSSSGMSSILNFSNFWFGSFLTWYPFLLRRTPQNRKATQVTIYKNLKLKSIPGQWRLNCPGTTLGKWLPVSLEF